MAFGLVRSTVLGLMERPEPASAVDDQLSDSALSGDALSSNPTSSERRLGWSDRRQEPKER